MVSINYISEIQTKTPPIQRIPPERPIQEDICEDNDKCFLNLRSKSLLSPTPLFGYPHHLHQLNDQLSMLKK